MSLSRWIQQLLTMQTRPSSKKKRHLNVEDAKVGHGVLPPLWGAESLVAQHTVKHHFNAEAEYNDDWDRDSSQDWVVVLWCLQAHAVNPNHEGGCPPVVVVASCMLGLSVHVAEGYPPRAAVRSLQ